MALGLMNDRYSNNILRIARTITYGTSKFGFNDEDRRKQGCEEKTHPHRGFAHKATKLAPHCTEDLLRSHVAWHVPFLLPTNHPEQTVYNLTVRSCPSKLYHLLDSSILANH